MELGPVDAVFGHAGHAYTLGLMRSIPDEGHARERLESIPGSPPEAGRMPPGCRFHPRCGFASDACKGDVPPLAWLGPRHQSACLHAELVQARSLLTPERTAP